MGKIDKLEQTFAWSYTSDYGQQVFDYNNAFGTKLQALEHLCMLAKVELTEELKREHGIDGFNENMHNEMERIKAELERLKVMQVKTYDLVTKKQEVVGEKTPSKPKAKTKKVNAK